MRFIPAALLLPLTAMAADTATAPAMREISPGIYQIGAIRIDQKQRTATFPGKVNMTMGNLEYLLVSGTGATHESLLSTEIQPADLHFSMLLLGAKGAGITTPGPDDAAPSQISKESLARAPRLRGDSIRIAVKWKAGDIAKTAPVEDWLYDFERNKPVSRGPWTYTGSMFHGERFVAQAEGAFAALVTYPGALINNPRPGNDNDLMWGPNAKTVPPVDTPVEITITLESEPASTK